MSHIRPTRRGSLFTPRLFSTRRGFTLVMMAIVLVIIMGCVAMTVDVGRIMIASQKAQNAADASALAAAPLLGTPSEALAEARDTITANNQSAGEYTVICGNSDIVYYGPNSTVPGFGALGPYARAIVVTAHIPLRYTFGAALGLSQTMVTRRAIAVRAPTDGVPISPMWISHPTPYTKYEYQNLLMADGPHFAEIPGSFGWLEIPKEMDAKWSQVLEGYPPLSETDLELSYTETGDVVWAKTGLAVGHWATPLRNRMARADAEFPGETYMNCSPDNPRIMLIPLVSYNGGTGSNANFTVEKFGAFWLDSIVTGGKDKVINGYFIDYAFPGGGLNALSTVEGLYTYRLVG